MCGEATLQLPADVVSSVLASGGDGGVPTPSGGQPPQELHVDVKGSKLTDFAEALAGTSFRAHRYTTALHMALLTILLKQQKDDQTDSDSELDEDLVAGATVRLTCCLSC